MPVFRLFLLWTPYLECRCLHRCFSASAWWTVCCLEGERGIFRCSSCQQSLRFFCPVPANFYAVCEQQGLRFTFIICVSVARSLLWFVRLSFWFLVALRYFRTLLYFKNNTIVPHLSPFHPEWFQESSHIRCAGMWWTPNLPCKPHICFLVTQEMNWRRV